MTGKRKISPPEARAYAVIRRLRTGKRPRSDSLLGALVKDLEERLLSDLGNDPDAAQMIRVGLVLQLVVAVAGVPIFSKGHDLHQSYKWSVGTLRGLISELYPAKAKASKPPKAESTSNDIAQAVMAALDEEE